MPTIQSTATKNGETNGKRAREDDGAQAPPAKKVDIKAEQ
jgi:lupus La protein